MRFSIVTRSPSIPHAGAVSEVEETLLHAFIALGHDASIVRGAYGPGINVILATTLLRQTMPPLPERSVIYNLEPFDAGAPFFPEPMRAVFREHVVWDYSARNLRNLQAAGLAMRGYHLPVGYVPELTRIEPAAIQDIDALFYGSVNRRRAELLDAMTRRGLRVVRAFNVYGAERDALIARARVVVNAHYYDSRIFEIVRVSYLLANRKAVVTEDSPDDDLMPDLRDGLAIAPYEGIAEAVEALVRNDRKRRALEVRGFEAFRRHPQAPVLARLVAELPRI